VVWNTRPTVGAQVGSSARTVSTTYASATPPQLVVNFEPIPAKPKVGHWRKRRTDGGQLAGHDDAAEAQFGAFQGRWRNFHPPGSLPLTAAEEQALADGSYNATLDSVADDFKAQAPREIWLTIGHEPENDLKETVVGWRSVDYRNMWAQVRARFNARGVTNVKWVMTYMGFETHRPIMDDLWPGDSLVDIVGQDPYIKKGAPAAELGQKMVERLVWLRDNEAANRHWGPQSKPQVFPEWGCDHGGETTDRGTDQHRADCITGVKNRLLELGQLNLIELDFYDAGSNWLTSTGVDQAAYRSLKTFSET
jgi:glycosyl hydrolase family 26